MWVLDHILLVYQHLGISLKRQFWIINLQKHVKSVKKQILTSFWSGQHPNTGRNIQHIKFSLTLVHKQFCLNYSSELRGLYTIFFCCWLATLPTLHYLIFCHHRDWKSLSKADMSIFSQITFDKTCYVRILTLIENVFSLFWFHIINVTERWWVGPLHAYFFSLFWGV